MSSFNVVKEDLSCLPKEIKHMIRDLTSELMLNEKLEEHSNIILRFETSPAYSKLQDLINTQRKWVDHFANGVFIRLLICSEIEGTQIYCFKIRSEESNSEWRIADDNTNRKTAKRCFRLFFEDYVHQCRILIKGVKHLSMPTLKEISALQTSIHDMFSKSADRCSSLWDILNELIN